MKNYILLLIVVISSYAYPIDAIKLPLMGVEVMEGNQSVVIEREVDPKCMNLTMNEETFWGASFASAQIPTPCKKSFVTTKGIIQPLHVHKDIETFAELEVLHFIQTKSSKFPHKYLLVDSRPSNWFKHSTIPSSINIPYNDLEVDETFKEEYTKAYKKLGVTIKNGQFDFKHAKEILLFCNGSWCTHSPRAMKTLLKIGYPAHKIKWYRGGITSWTSVGLTLIKK
jgi:rhodanese-related sulfurtransferase